MENQQQPLINFQPVSLPNATAVLVLGIISIVSCCCYGLPGIICAVIAMVLAKKDMNLYAAAPGHYTESSYKNLKAGRVCAIIGLSLSILYAVCIIAFIAMYGLAILSNPNMWQQMQHMQHMH